MIYFLIKDLRFVEHSSRCDCNYISVWVWNERHHCYKVHKENLHNTFLIVGVERGIRKHTNKAYLLIHGNTAASLQSSEGTFISFSIDICSGFIPKQSLFFFLSVES